MKRRRRRIFGRRNRPRVLRLAGVLLWFALLATVLHLPQREITRWLIDRLG